MGVKGTTKYGNIKSQVDGITFDSKIEAYMYGLLRQTKLAGYLTMQESIELQPAFRCSSGSNIRAIATRIDFVIKCRGYVIYIDTKGIVTPEFKMKWKMLRYMNKSHTNRYYYLPNTQSMCREIVANVLKLLET
jgi:hypothetical protein